MKQGTIEEAITAAETAERKAGRIGRPAGESSKVTAVNLNDAMRAIKNGDKVKQIEHWLDTVNVNTLIANAATATLKIIQAGHGYRPIKLVYDYDAEASVTGNKMNDYDLNDRYPRSLIYEKKTSIRMPMRLFNRVLKASEAMGNRPSDVIKLALSGMYLDNGAALVEKAGELSEFDLLQLPSHAAKERKNSTLVLRQKRDRLKYKLENLPGDATDEERAALEAQIASIRA